LFGFRFDNPKQESGSLHSWLLQPAHRESFNNMHKH